MSPTPASQPRPLSLLAAPCPPPPFCSLIYKIMTVEWTHSLSTPCHPPLLTRVGRGPEQARHSLSGGMGPLSRLPPWPGVLQKGGAQPRKQWQFWLLLQTWSEGRARVSARQRALPAPQGPSPPTWAQRSPRTPGTRTPWPLHFFPQPSVSKKEVFLHCPSKQICSEEETKLSVQWKDTVWPTGGCGSKNIWDSEMQLRSGYLLQRKTENGQKSQDGMIVD